jgi:sporulation protein YlmC with PRC-barrel domain
LKAVKALICYATMVVVLGVAAETAGQSERPNGSKSSAGYIQTSKLVGKKVESAEGEEIGVFKDVVIDRSSGCLAYTILSTGGEGTGVVSGGGKIVAVPWAAYSLTSHLGVLRVNVDRDKIYNAPAFDYSRMDEYARPDYIDNVYSYYGVSPGPRTGVAAGTDVTGTAGATASPGQVVSQTAGAMGSPNQKASTQRHASLRANASPKATRSVRGIGARPSIDRAETASSTTTEESPSESPRSPNENNKSRRNAIGDTPTRTPRTTPESAEGQN